MRRFRAPLSGLDKFFAAQFSAGYITSMSGFDLRQAQAAKTGPVPTHEGLGPDDRDNLQDRRKPAIELDKEPAIIICEPGAAVQPTLQDNQLMSKHRILSLKPHLRLEWQGRS